MDYKWRRPESLPYPTLYRRFHARDIYSNSSLVYFRIQDLPEDRFEEAIEHMTENFLRDENFCRTTGLKASPEGITANQDLWRSLLRQKVSIVCFKEGSDEIISVNILGVVQKDEKDLEYIPTSFPWTQIFGSLAYVSERIDVFEKYNVDKYITAFGLSVNPKYRGRGVACEMLKARVPLGQTIGVPLTATVFTAEGSQIPAERAGYTTDVEITYDELDAKLGYKFPGNTTKSVKLMSCLIPLS